MFDSTQIDALLAGSVERGEVPGIVATLSSADGSLYEGAFGSFEVRSGPAYSIDTPLRIASMTKAVTSVAAMQLVEQGKLELDEPVARWLPELSTPHVLEADGTLRPAKTQITARHLLTHTAGFGYEIWSDRLVAHVREHRPPEREGGGEFLANPLLFDPGEHWNYGVNTDWLGELIVAVSGQPLSGYFGEQILGPLGMNSSSFWLPEERDAELPPIHGRLRNGTLEPEGSAIPRAAYESGGGGLHSTAADYQRFLRMLLGRGELDGVRVLEPATVEAMATSQTGDLEVGKLESAKRERSNSGDLSFGHDAGFGLGFLITLQTSRTGRSDGSMSWAGVFNTYYWIDLARDVAGALYTQVLPFLDGMVLDINREFERGAYEALDDASG
jgi:CubicO group peptidase (beta-lactamase class C family)